MTRRIHYWSCKSDAEAPGSAGVRDNGLDMTGAYMNGRCMVSHGTPVELRLRRIGQSLEALSIGTDPLTRTLMLHRVPP
jgi:hypothetical protein